MIAIPANIKTMLTRRFVVVAGLLMLASVVTSACAVQESNTYPVETFSEMHYSQSFRMQEPPRLAPLANAVVFESTGDPDQVSKIPDKRERPYDAGVAGELYRVNCSVCHGLEGLGDGRAVRHITSGSSFYASEHDNSPYPTSPPNLVNSAAERFTSRDGMYGFVSSVLSFNPDSATNSVMPAFSKLLPEEDIRDIVNYIFDDTAGLSR